MSRKRLIGLLFLLLNAPARADEVLPLPDELAPDVGFWVRIFAEVDSDRGLLHDNRYLGVVYAELEVPLDQGSRQRQRQVDAERERVHKALVALAAGKRTGLDADEKRVLDAWGDNTDNATFRAAADRIRFQRGLSDRFRAGYERSGLWRSHIVSEFGRLGVPLQLVALPHVESSFNPSARSVVGASGIWQFTRSTGRRFLAVDHILDERNDPFAASTAAGQLLAFNYSITGNWPTAITAYNHGLSGVRRAMREYGDTAYVDILRKYDGRTFGFASRNFYVAFLAAAKVDREASRYFPGVTTQQPIRYEILRTPDFVAVEALATALGIDTQELARHNGALQPTIWQGSKLVPRDYALRVPASAIARPVTDLLAAVPAGAWADEQLPDLFHTVARGDTLSQIAEEFDTTIATLVALNGLDSRHRIRAGQQLRLPAAGPQPPDAMAVEAEVVAEVEAPPDEEIVLEEAEPAALSGELAEVADAAAAEAPTAQTGLLSDPSDYSVGEDGTIEVQSLETLGHLADWLGIRTQRLRDANGLAFGAPVAAGDRLRLVFDDIAAAEFENRRVAFHRSQQDRYFREHQIAGVTEHEIQRGESVWVLALREYDVPLWLFRQYNPELDLHRVRPGVRVRFPVLQDRVDGE